MEHHGREDGIGVKVCPHCMTPNAPHRTTCGRCAEMLRARSAIDCGACVREVRELRDQLRKLRRELAFRCEYYEKHGAEKNCTTCSLADQEVERGSCCSQNEERAFAYQEVLKKIADGDGDPHDEFESNAQRRAKRALAEHPQFRACEKCHSLVEVSRTMVRGAMHFCPDCAENA